MAGNTDRIENLHTFAGIAKNVGEAVPFVGGPLKAAAGLAITALQACQVTLLTQNLVVIPRLNVPSHQKYQAVRDECTTVIRQATELSSGLNAVACDDLDDQTRMRIESLTRLV